MSDDLPEIPDMDRSDDFELLRLTDGRSLAYLEWGDPEGFPTFYFHGTPSSRLEAAFAHAAARRHGIKLIATDRPGYGRSDFQSGRCFSDWPRDITALADHLGITAFGVAGHSGAGPHLFACGVFIDPERLKFIGALGPFGPVASPQIASGLGKLDRFYLKLARRVPRIMHLAFAPIGLAARYWPGLFFGVMRSSVAKADKRALKNQSFLATFRRMEREAFRQGSRAAAHEAFLCYTPWDFDISDIQVPTYIWLGAEDIFVPNDMGRHLEHRIPGVEFHLIPGKGHFNIEDWDNILAGCARHIP